MKPTNQQRGAASTVLIIIFAVLAAVGVAGALFNQNRVMQLQKQLADTQKQLEAVTQATTDATDEVANAKMQGAKDIIASIKNVENPSLRLQLFNAYAKRLKAKLTPELQKDLDTIVVYVTKQPVVLVQPPAQFPEEVDAAMTNLKAAAKSLKSTSVAVMEKSDDTSATTSAKVGTEVTITGPLTKVETDTITGGTVFAITDSTDGYNYYFYFNETNSATLEPMVGQDVAVDIKITADKSGIVSYDVMTLPTLATETATATPEPTPGE